MLNDNISYKDIMEKFDIGKSSLSEYKGKIKKGIIKVPPKTELENEKSTELPNSEKLENEKSTKPEEKLKKKTEDKKETIITPNSHSIISETEFRILENAIALIDKSNRKRYEVGRSTGMINALDNIIMIKDKIKNSGGFK